MNDCSGAKCTWLVTTCLTGPRLRISGRKILSEEKNQAVCQNQFGNAGRWQGGVAGRGLGKMGWVADIGSWLKDIKWICCSPWAFPSSCCGPCPKGNADSMRGSGDLSATDRRLPFICSDTRWRGAHQVQALGLSRGHPRERADPGKRATSRALAGMQLVYGCGSP